MKKKRRSRTLQLLSGLFNVRAWADWDRMQAFTSYLFIGVKRLFSPDESIASEAFSKAQARLHLSNKDLLVKQNSLYRLCMIMLVAAGCIFLYTLYQLIFGSFMAALVSLIVMLIAFALAFRYHFWYFQIKNRKLGCTFDEWYQQVIKGGKV